MRGIARLHKDKAGGKVIFTPVRGATFNSVEAVVEGATVARHASGVLAAPRIRRRSVPAHKNVPIVEFSKNVFVGGKPVAREGDAAQCRHVLTGSKNIFIN